PGDAAGLRADADAAAVERGERDLEALPGLAEEGVGADLDAVEDDLHRRRAAQAHLVLGLAGRQAWRPLLHEEGAHALLALGPDDDQAGPVAARDPLLRAVEAPARGRPTRARAQRSRVGAGVRLGEREAADE